MRVTSKRRMYRLLDAGAFGNTTDRWYSLDDWRAAAGPRPAGLWAVRNAERPGDPRCRLDVPAAELPGLYAGWYGAAGGEISPMVDHMLTARFQMIEDHRGLLLEAVLGRPDLKWREAFRDPLRLGGAAAGAVLRQYLNENSLEDLCEVLGAFPGHAVEMTALDRCYGTVPHRNAVVWEVRDY